MVSAGLNLGNAWAKLGKSPRMNIGLQVSIINTLNIGHPKRALDSDHLEVVCENTLAAFNALSLFGNKKDLRLRGTF